MSSHFAVYLRSMGEFEMAEEVLSMHNRLEAFADGLDRAALDCAINAAEEAIKQRDELLEALEKMNRAYVGLMENGRDRILTLGGDCDPVDVMERGDPNLRESRAAIASVKGGAS